MGLDKIVYAGAMVRCSFVKNKKTRNIKTYCGDCGHGQKKGLSSEIKFCPCCGEKVIKDITEKNERMTFNDVIESAGINPDYFRIVDYNYHEDDWYLLFNQDFQSVWVFDYANTTILEPELVKGKVEDAVKMHKKMIDKLKPYFMNVSVEFVIKSDYI